MIEARVNVDPRSIRPRPSGPATGEIWVRMGSTDFPVHRWNDFVVVILRAFVVAAARLIAGAPEARVHFMDGPHAVDLSRGPDSWNVRLVDTGTREVVREEARVPAAPLVESALAAADAVLSAHRQGGFWSSDADALADDTSRMRDLLGVTPRGGT